ncbi:MAG: hypothetical protein ACLFP1_05075 [Candidatus Goldiibacteriota bacterium]
MKKVKLFANVTLVVTIILAVLEAVGFMLFEDIYKMNFGVLLVSQDTFQFGLKLLLSALAAGFVFTVIFDTVYRALPGGFLRKGLNFAFMLWGIKIVPLFGLFYIALDFTRDFYFLLAVKFIIIDMIIAFVLTGIYDEFHLRAEKEKAQEGGTVIAPKKRAADEKKESQESEEDNTQEEESRDDDNDEKNKTNDRSDI